MAGDDGGNKIVKTEYNPNAGTCESHIYITANGKRWRETANSQPATGESIGVIRGDKIEPE